MAFAAVRTFAFRNLSDVEVDVNADDIFLVGENGQGKTNFLEAIYFSSYGSSFRGARDSELARRGEPSCGVSSTLVSGPHETVTVRIDGGKKQVQVDGKRLEDRKELLDISACVVFCHEDMEFVSGAPERRRWFFDQTLSLFDREYIDDLRTYRKILKTRNLLLKEGKRDLLDFVDQQLVEAGLPLVRKRQSVVGAFSTTFGRLYEGVSGIPAVELRYYPSWKSDDREALSATLKERREAEAAMGTTLSGPHRDRFLFYRGTSEYASSASTGQRRLLALALRTAQAEFYSERTGRRPILLLDDVLLELDPAKRKRFVAAIPAYDQAFFTFLPGEPYDEYRRGRTKIISVREGVLIHEESR